MVKRRRLGSAITQGVDGLPLVAYHNERREGRRLLEPVLHPVLPPPPTS
jgi:hypothetical protein